MLQTILSFANDSSSGGYIVIGAADEGDGRAKLPPSALTVAEVESARWWICGKCNQFDPPYQPILCCARYCGQPILVVWAPVSDSKPHRGPFGGADVKKVLSVAKEIREHEERGELGLDQMAHLLDNFESGTCAHSHITNMLIEIYIEAKKEKNAEHLLRDCRFKPTGQEAIDAAFLASRVLDAEAACRFFERADLLALLDCVKSKIRLADLSGSSEHDRQRFPNEARRLLDAIEEQCRQGYPTPEMKKEVEEVEKEVERVEEAYRRSIALLQNSMPPKGRNHGPTPTRD